jgi:hypothetical protein
MFKAMFTWKFLKRGLAFIAILQAVRLSLLFVGGLSYEAGNPVAVCGTGWQYYLILAAMNNEAYVAGLIVASIFYTWRQTVDPIFKPWKLPWRLRLVREPLDDDAAHRGNDHVAV